MSNQSNFQSRLMGILIQTINDFQGKLDAVVSRDSEEAATRICAAYMALSEMINMTLNMFPMYSQLKKQSEEFAERALKEPKTNIDPKAN